MQILFLIIIGFIVGLFYSKGKNNPPRRAWVDFGRGVSFCFRKVKELFQSNNH